ncbi:HD domain-containing protein [Belliella sp. R4-6]|uniref:HD domain-containing protein n=1 Tax=Belliella alkalica TaxID=1730871 RepID=A0ABS9VDN6_9BACT|nr:HD domain-containing protein [Belliella alkalica]MCH7414558.1 HD domain-containing protein [Belliella alkalica]
MKYHNAAHTRQVIQSVEIIAAAENVSDRDLELLRVAALFHDIGYLQNREEHEALSCEEARKVLPEFGLAQNEIDKICGMIMATKIPQMPNNHLEKIMADADLEYIGTEHYEKGSDLLFTEMKHFSPNLEAKEWHKLKIEFLEQHQFHTDFCIKSRESNKAENLRRLKSVKFAD